MTHISHLSLVKGSKTDLRNEGIRRKYSKLSESVKIENGIQAIPKRRDGVCQ